MKINLNFQIIHILPLIVLLLFLIIFDYLEEALSSDKDEYKDLVIPNYTKKLDEYLNYFNKECDRFENFVKEYRASLNEAKEKYEKLVGKSDNENSIEGVAKSIKIEESSTYEIIYDCDDYYGDKNTVSETFEGSWVELQDYIKELKDNDCYNIDATAIGDPDEYEENW